MDIRFYWLRDIYIQQKQFHKHCKCDEHNLGDYPTKHQLEKHHGTVRPIYVANKPTKFHESFAIDIIKLQSVCEGVLNNNPQRKGWK